MAKSRPVNQAVEAKAVAATSGQVLAPPKVGPGGSTQLPTVSDVANSAMSFGQLPQLNYDMNFGDVGSQGLRAFSGWVREEFLPQLQGRQGAQKYREMMDNSPTIGAILLAIRSTMRKVEWRVNPANDSPEAQEAAEFVESCMDDMSHPWVDLIDENLSMLGYGYAPHEIVYKRRMGRRPGMGPNGKELPKSNYDDGLISWRRIPIRGQDTVLKWFFDENGNVQGMTQQPWTGPLIDIPIQKMLLFRPVVYKGNPEGRALDPATMIPTPDGWRKLDDLVAGSKVFDETGAIRYVTARADWNDRPCFEVEFGDGAKIIADANHQWVTRNLYQRTKGRAGKVRTTAEIAATCRAKNPGGSANHSIPWCGELDYPEQCLPIAPYYLGLWLGDGTSLSSSVSCHADDLAETCELIEACGYQTRAVPNGRQGENGRLIVVQGGERWDSRGPQALLTALGLRGNKHIPAAYLRGSVDQRRALLAGLMDSDGHADDYGRCEFTNTDMGLIYGVAELVRSLGCGATVGLRKRANGVDHKKDAWVVRFRPIWTPFRLARKQAKVVRERARAEHYIVAVRPVDNRRTVCIEVDSPSHLFLAGETMVPTHNSILRNCWRPYWFIKRLEEQEAIRFERLNGFPIVRVPNELLQAAQAGDAPAILALNSYKKMATNVRVDEQMGAVLPSNTWEGTNGPSQALMYDLTFATPDGGRSAVNAHETISRYSNDMLMSALADFISMGHTQRGAQNLGETKVDMFFQAIEGYLNGIASVYNRYAITRLWDLNGLDPDLAPTIEPDLAQRTDLDVLGNFVLRMSQAGMPLFPDDDLQTVLRDAAGLPDVTDPRATDALVTNLDAQAAAAQQAQNDANAPQDDLQKIIKASIARRFVKMNGACGHSHIRKRRGKRVAK